MFKNPVPPELHLPVLNRPPDPVPVAVDEPSVANNNAHQQNGASTSTANYTAQLRLRKTAAPNRQRVQPDTFVESIRFQSFEHFAISRVGIQQMCDELVGSDGMDVHIVFEEDLPRLPRIGLSCLSLKDLYEDRVLLQGPSTTPNNLPFVKLLPMLDEDKKLIPWARVKPRKGQTFTVSLELVESTNLRFRFSFEAECPSPWYSIDYLPYMPDYSLVLAIPKSELLKQTDDGKLKASVQIMSTYGWLRWKARQQKQESEEQLQRLDMGVSTDLVAGECVVCMDGGSDTLFYPCCHLIVHRHCVRADSDTKHCFKCREESSKLITIKKKGDVCTFCGPDSGCRLFNSFFEPCGCSIGCFDGFRWNAKNMGLNCVVCGYMIQNVLKIFVSNAAD